RATFRALRESTGVDVLISMIGVVDVHHTLIQVMGCDLVGNFLEGRQLPVYQNVLGYRVGEAFIRDLVSQNLYSLDSTVDDVAACRFPIVHIAAETDTWTHHADVEYVFAPKHQHSGGRELCLLAGASHKIENNPNAGREALCH